MGADGLYCSPDGAAVGVYGIRIRGRHGIAGKIVIETIVDDEAGDGAFLGRIVQIGPDPLIDLSVRGQEGQIPLEEGFHNAVVFVSVNARLNYVGYLDLTAIGGDANIGVADTNSSFSFLYRF